MPKIRPDVRTAPVVRAEIPRSGEPSGVLAERHGVSAETVRERRKRGPEDRLDRSARPRELPWKATDEQRAVVRALRRPTSFALGDPTSAAAASCRAATVTASGASSRRRVEPAAVAVVGPVEKGPGQPPRPRSRLRAHRR